LHVCHCLVACGVCWRSVVIRLDVVYLCGMCDHGGCLLGLTCSMRVCWAQCALCLSYWPTHVSVLSCLAWCLRAATEAGVDVRSWKGPAHAHSWPRQAAANHSSLPWLAGLKGHHLLGYAVLTSLRPCGPNTCTATRARPGPSGIVTKKDLHGQVFCGVSSTGTAASVWVGVKHTHQPGREGRRGMHVTSLGARLSCQNLELLAYTTVLAGSINECRPCTVRHCNCRREQI
jgi:hypothetical protein